MSIVPALSTQTLTSYEKLIALHRESLEITDPREQEKFIQAGYAKIKSSISHPKGKKLFDDAEKLGLKSTPIIARSLVDLGFLEVNGNGSNGTAYRSGNGKTFPNPAQVIFDARNKRSREDRSLEATPIKSPEEVKRLEKLEQKFKKEIARNYPKLPDQLKKMMLSDMMLISQNSSRDDFLADRLIDEYNAMQSEIAPIDKYYKEHGRFTEEFENMIKGLVFDEANADSIKGFEEAERIKEAFSAYNREQGALSDKNAFLDNFEKNVLQEESAFKSLIALMQIFQQDQSLELENPSAKDFTSLDLGGIDQTELPFQKGFDNFILEARELYKQGSLTSQIQKLEEPMQKTLEYLFEGYKDKDLLELHSVIAKNYRPVLEALYYIPKKLQSSKLYQKAGLPLPAGMRTPEAIAHGKKVQSVYLALKIVLNEESDAIKAADDLTENIAELREHIYLAQDHLKQNPGEYTEKEKASLKEALDLDFDSIYNALANKDILKIPKDSLLTLEKTLISNQKREIMVEAQSYQPIIDAMEIIVSSKDLNDLSTAHGFLSDGVLSDIFGADVATAVLGEKTKSPKPVTSHVLSTLKEQEAAIQRELGDRKERFKDYEKNFLEPMADNLYRIRSFIICSDYSKDLDTGKFTDGGKKIVNWKGLPEDLQDISLDDLDKYAKAQGLKKLSSELAKEV